MTNDQLDLSSSDDNNGLQQRIIDLKKEKSK